MVRDSNCAGARSLERAREARVVRELSNMEISDAQIGGVGIYRLSDGGAKPELRRRLLVL